MLIFTQAYNYGIDRIFTYLLKRTVNVNSDKIYLNKNQNFQAYSQLESRKKDILVNRLKCKLYLETELFNIA